MSDRAEGVVTEADELINRLELAQREMLFVKRDFRDPEVDVGFELETVRLFLRQAEERLDSLEKILCSERPNLFAKQRHKALLRAIEKKTESICQGMLDLPEDCSQALPLPEVHRVTFRFHDHQQWEDVLFVVTWKELSRHMGTPRRLLGMVDGRQVGERHPDVFRDSDGVLASCETQYEKDRLPKGLTVWAVQPRENMLVRSYRYPLVSQEESYGQVRFVSSKKLAVWPLRSDIYETFLRAQRQAAKGKREREENSVQLATEPVQALTPQKDST